MLEFLRNAANAVWGNVSSFWSAEAAPAIAAQAPDVDDLSEDDVSDYASVASDCEEDDENEEFDTDAFINETIAGARRRQAEQTYIQQLQAYIEDLAKEVQALRGNRLQRAAQRASTGLSNMIGGQIGKFLKALGLKSSALAAGYYGLKAVSAGLGFLNLVVETVKTIATTVFNTVGTIFSSIFGGISGLFNGDFGIGAGIAALVGLGALLFNRDKVTPAINHATNLAGNAFTAAKTFAGECVGSATNNLGATGEFHAFNRFKDRAKQRFSDACEGFNNVCESAQNISADDIYRMMKRAIKRNAPQ